MTLIAAHVRNAVLTIGLTRTRPALSRACRDLNMALGEANRSGNNRAKASIMRMTNWLRAEMRRAQS